MNEAESILRRLMIAFDADQDEEFDEVMVEARVLLGFVRVGDDEIEKAQRHIRSGLMTAQEVRDMLEGETE